jgi:RNase P subunit RPR2
VQQLQRLFELAEVAVQQGDEALGRHYLDVARHMVQRTRVRLPRELRYRYCHRCGRLFRPGKNSRVRIRSDGQTRSLVITCLACGFRQKLLWHPRARQSVTKSEPKSSADEGRSWANEGQA